MGKPMVGAFELCSDHDEVAQGDQVHLQRHQGPSELGGDELVTGRDETEVVSWVLTGLYERLKPSVLRADGWGVREWPCSAPPTRYRPSGRVPPGSGQTCSKRRGRCRSQSSTRRCCRRASPQSAGRPASPTCCARWASRGEESAAGFGLRAMSLDQLVSESAEVVPAGWSVRAVRPHTVEELRAELRASNDERRRLVSNFARSSLFGGGSGHHSPSAATSSRRTWPSSST